MLARLVFWGSVLNRMSGWRMSSINRFLYRVTGGRLGGWIPGVRLLLLTTTGRRSGTKRTVPVAYWREGDDVIVGAAAGAARVDPLWVANLRADPRAAVQIKGETRSVLATELGPSEQEAFWRANDSPLARLIESRTPRTIPFFRLSPA
jgi:deazaflavin-dependent oxidoreductase (nitroreductase family)